MSDQSAIAGELNGSILLPGSWEEPKEEFPAQITAFGIRWSDPDYNKATEFRVAFPMRKHTDASGNVVEHNSVQQLDIQLKRLDAVYVHEDGSDFELRDGTRAQTAPVTVYAGVDLEKFDQKNGVIRPLKKTNGKEQFVIKGWTEKYGALFPDTSRLIGQFVQVIRYREKEFNGFPAKNVVVPKELLPPTYRYTGEVQKFKAQRDVNENAVATAASAGLSGGAALSKAEAAEKIGIFLKSMAITNPGPEALGLAGFPVDARIEPFITEFAMGNGAKVLAEAGVTL